MKNENNTNTIWPSIISKQMIKKVDNNEVVPFMYLKNSIILPGWSVNLIVDGKDDVKIINDAIKNKSNLALVFYKNDKDNNTSNIGLLCNILHSWQFDENLLSLAVEGLQRIEIIKIKDSIKKNHAEIRRINPEDDKNVEIEALSRNTLNLFKKVSEFEGKFSKITLGQILKNNNPNMLSDAIVQFIDVNFKEKLDFLETLDTKKRLEMVNSKLIKELNILEAEKKIESSVKKEINQEQREIILREKLKAIEKELGISKDKKEYDDFEFKIKDAKMPINTEKKALKELARLKKNNSFSPETGYIRSYIESLIELPWSIKTKDELKPQKARKILDEDHYGLNKAKERVLEFLAVQKLTHGKNKSNIMCFIGPPGTGKTSVGKSIARALKRKFTRISLGGIRDEAEIRGHRRTYIGAMPGRIINGIKNAGTKNPVFMLDEIDKIGNDFRGDPSAALLEVLDPEQNNSFSDHYIEEPFDLSEVFFITTANIADTIPAPLRDRMEIIEFPGYTDYEKLQISKKHLINRVIKNSGLSPSQFNITDSALNSIIHKYTREAGVRNLERKLTEVARKIALKITEKRNIKNITIDESSISDYLGPEKFLETFREKKDEIGIATGLAWTPVGGEIILIESAIFPGNGKLILTGQLGKVMEESAQTALSYIKKISGHLKIDTDLFNKNDIHIHVPQAAVSKDGPSAGIAMAATLASILTRKKLKKEIAMTGEITLSGKILEIGGLKEKVLAAHRAGIKKIILPKNNKKDLIDIPKEITKELKFIFIDRIDDGLKEVLI